MFNHKKYFWLAVGTFYLYVFDLVFYNAMSIRQYTNTWEWHLAQYALIILGFTVGYFIRAWYETILLSWHNFGRLVGVFAPGVTIYVYSLHFILHRW